MSNEGKEIIINPSCLDRIHYENKEANWGTLRDLLTRYTLSGIIQYEAPGRVEVILDEIGKEAAVLNRNYGRLTLYDGQYYLVEEIK